MRSVLLPALLALCSCRGPDPLPSWNEGPAKQRLLEFVRTSTNPSHPNHVPESERIAVFDNDGTLWVEQPTYTQIAFALDRVRALAPEHPEWKTTEPFASVLANDLSGLSHADIFAIVAATHAGMTREEFMIDVREWLATTTHPRFDRPFTELAYQPMLELLELLRGRGYKTFIVTGGTIDFVRAFARETYGIPSEQVVGTRLEIEYERRDGRGVLVRKPKIDFNNDKQGKPAGIAIQIGKRPVLAFGNSDGDFEMLEYSSPGLGLIVHHDDADREYAYDRKSSIGRLDRALDEAKGRGWVVVSVKRDWKRVFGER
jgi:phosphoserine phosphatase